MDKYRLNLYISGLENDLIESIKLSDIVVMKKGDICNVRTGKKYIETTIRKTVFTTYEEGFEVALDNMLRFIDSNKTILELINKARSISFQICVDLDDECNVPYIHFSPKQLGDLAKMRAELEFHIS